jgi:hypothetical protein
VVGGDRLITDRLVEDPDAVAVLASTVSDRTGIPAAHIEKDFWVTEVLRGVVAAAAAADVEVVFKGGTSLSKAFGLIERFSEDVDVLVVLSANDSSGERDRVLKAIVDGAAKAAGVAATPVPDATSKGVKRGARFHYRPGGEANAAGLSPGVFLELGTRGGGMPATPLEVSSIIARHAADEIAGVEEAAPFVVRVQAPWRTLVEKLVLLHTAHSGGDPTEATRGAPISTTCINSSYAPRSSPGSTSAAWRSWPVTSAPTPEPLTCRPSTVPPVGSRRARHSTMVPTSRRPEPSTRIGYSPNSCGQQPATRPSTSASRPCVNERFTSNRRAGVPRGQQRLPALRERGCRGYRPGGVVEVFHDGSSHTAQMKDPDRARRYLRLP